MSATTAPTLGDAVPRAKALAASATWSLNLPDLPEAAPAMLRAAGRSYYLDSVNGQDTNDGRAAGPAANSAQNSGPWRTLARLQRSDLGPGDAVEFACGSVWRETLKLPAGGTTGLPITLMQPISGCAVLPTIDGSTPIAPSAWTRYRGNIFRAALDTLPLQVTSPGSVMTVAHHPNREDARTDPGSPYLALAEASNGNVLTTGADLVLPAGATMTSKTRVRVRTNPYIIDEADVTSFDGTRIRLAKAPTYPVGQGWGYFLTGELWMLDSAGEWFYDAAARQLYAWMPDSVAPTSSIAVATLPTGIDLQGLANVVVDGLAVRNTGVGVDLSRTRNVTLRNMQIIDIATVGIAAGASRNDVVESSSIVRTGSDAVSGWGAVLVGWGGPPGSFIGDSTGLTVRNNFIRDSGVLMQNEQVLSLPKRSLAAIFTGTDGVASGNVIVNAGYIGILAQPGTLVADNFVFGACSVLDDCGAIYTGAEYNRSQILRNTVVRSRGALAGQPLLSRATSAQGIYVDDDGADVVIQNNTVIDADHGIQLHNTARNIVSGNRLYANRRSQIWMQEDSTKRLASGDMVGNAVQGNQLAPISSNAVGLLLTTRFNSTTGFGSFDANRYDDRASSTVALGASSTGRSSYNFSRWSGSTGNGSTRPVDPTGASVVQRGHASYSVSGANLVANSALLVDAAGWSSWNATAPAGQAMRESCATDTCSGYALRYVAGGSSGVLSSHGFALQQSAWYRLSVDVSTQTDGQAVPLVVRIGSGDYASVSDRNLSFVANRAWSRHTVVFQATRSMAGSAARIDIDGIEAGKSISVSGLELVPIRPSALAMVSGVVANPSARAMSAVCPFTAAGAPTCESLFNLADDKPVQWPVSIAPRSSMIFYAQDRSLLDADGDGIPDAQDRCASSRPGAAVNASGCELSAQGVN